MAKRPIKKAAPRAPLTKGLVPGEGRAPRKPPAPTPKPVAADHVDVVSQLARAAVDGILACSPAELAASCDHEALAAAALVIRRALNPVAVAVVGGCDHPKAKENVQSYGVFCGVCGHKVR